MWSVARHRGNSRLEETTFDSISTLLQVNKPYVFPKPQDQMPEMLWVNLENVHPTLKKLFKGSMSSVSLRGEQIFSGTIGSY